LLRDELHADSIRSVKTRAQNNEMRFRVIAYNAARITNLAYSLFRESPQNRS